MSAVIDLLQLSHSEQVATFLEKMKQVSPVAWVNVNFNGTYLFEVEHNMVDLDKITQANHFKTVTF